MTNSAVPTSRLGRLARFAMLSTRAGTGKLAGLLGDQKEAEAGIASAAASALGTMRGLALKLGQMASYVDGVVPDEHRETYERAMKSLRDAAPAMPPEAAARVVESELGAPPGKLFDEWAPAPFASASIGQVHRARLRDGREVAVKVQYEGIDRAVASDLANASMMTSLLGPLATKFAMKDQVREMRDRFEEELDYRHEAGRQSEFRALFEGDERVLVPGVIEERSSRRVLTTELVAGLGFDAACAAPEHERRAWAETLWRFVFKSLLQHGLFNADPHPGNYLFVDGTSGRPGQAWFLDFGCTRRILPEQARLVRAGHRAAIAGDEKGLANAMLRNFHMREGTEGARLGAEYVVRCFAPILHRGPYKITHEYARSLMDGMRENFHAMRRGAKDQFSSLPPEWLFFNRLQLGFYSVLARLDVAVDYQAADASVLPAE
jgi:predicted unusual protein kinase regulating ubiquinone biosynthesis (AarF/ABC1/UbiB family)